MSDRKCYYLFNKKIVLALSMVQALACGCPVIASEHTGARDLFEDGVQGFIVPIRDPHQSLVV